MTSAKFRSGLLAGFAAGTFLAFAAGPAAAATGYTGDYKLKTDFKDGPRVLAGKLTGKGARMRIEYADKELGVVVLNFATQQAVVMFPATKRFLEVDMTKMGAPLPKCAAQTPVDCYARNGFVRLTAPGKLENASGMMCEHFEKKDGKDSSGKAYQLAVWTPPEMPELPYVRLKSVSDAGVVNEHEITNVKRGQPVADSLFETPTDYTKPGDPKGTAGATRGALPAKPAKK